MNLYTNGNRLSNTENKVMFTKAGGYTYRHTFCLRFHQAGDSLSTRALMHKGSWRRTQSFLITVPSVAVTHVRVPTPTPTQDLAAFSQLSGSQGAKGAPPRPCLTRPAF